MGLLRRLYEFFRHPKVVAALEALRLLLFLLALASVWWAASQLMLEDVVITSDFTESWAWPSEDQVDASAPEVSKASTLVRQEPSSPDSDERSSLLIISMVAILVVCGIGFGVLFFLEE